MTRLPHPFLMPMQTLSAPGAADTLIPACRAFGPRGVLVYGHSLKQNGALARILGDSCQACHDILPWQHPGGEPTLTQLEQLLNVVRAHGPDWIAAIGGGSVMDLAKAAAGLADAPRPVVDYHNGAPIDPTRIAFIAVPTTAGTGSEATMVSVLTHAESCVKRSIRHPSMLARLVILDPNLLASCPKPVVAASGLDALTQAIESFTSRYASPVTDHFAQEAVAAISHALRPVYHGQDGYAAELLEGSYLAGLALSNARLGIMHGLAHPLGARFHLPHGLVCGVCLPLALAFNRDAMGAKYTRLSHIVGSDIASWVRDLMDGLHIENPFRGIHIDAREAIISETLASGSTQANPRPVNTADVEALLDALTAA